MRIRESRRITGRHLLLPGPGAAAEATPEGPADEARLAGWTVRTRAITAALGWDGPVATRSHGNGTMSVAISAPPDLLDLATEVVEETLEGTPNVDALRRRADEAANLPLRRALAEAAARGIPAFADDEGLTVGVGRQARTLPLDAIPSELPSAGRVPFVYVTGTNGKTTTTRWIARMAREAGLAAGYTCSDGIVVSDRVLDTGDWSGPGAARRLLREPVDLAVLETARGGMLRRGLALDGADAAVVTNVTADHFGEWGIDDLAGMAEVKLLVAGAVRPGGTLVVNGEDPAIAAELPRVMGRRPDLRVARFSTSDATAAASVRDGIVFLGGEPLLPVADIPLALRGHARHNIENALAAALAAEACGVPRAAIAAGLRSLRPSVADSHGRTNLFAVRGADVLVDFAHNPDGLRRIAELARSWPASRRLLLLGQSGDRTDALIADFVREAVRIAPDRMLIKELPGHLRGRAPGEVPAILHRMLREEGVPEDRIAHVADEVEGAREALAWSKPGDLLLLFVHERPEDVYAVLAEAGAEPAT